MISIYGKYYAEHDSKDKKICIALKKDGKICGEIISSKAYSTSALKSHLNSAHSIFNPKAINENVKTPSITRFTTKLDPFDQNTLSFTIARLVCQDLMSINLVGKSKGIKTLLKKAYNVNSISPYFIWKHVDMVYCDLKKAIQDI